MSFIWTKTQRFGSMKWDGSSEIRVFVKRAVWPVWHVDFFWSFLTFIFDLDFILFYFLNFFLKNVLFSLVYFILLVYFYFTCCLLICFVYWRNCRKLGKSKENFILVKYIFWYDLFWYFKICVDLMIINLLITCSIFSM